MNQNIICYSYFYFIFLTTQAPRATQSVDADMQALGRLHCHKVGRQTSKIGKAKEVHFVHLYSNVILMTCMNYRIGY